MTSLEVAQEIKSQLSYNPPVVWSWGASDWTALNRTDLILGGLRFKVRGRKLKGYVQVNLMPSDTYDVIFYKGLANPKEVKKLTDIYCDQLLTIIDETVET